MTFQLTEQDLARAEAAATVLLSPLNYADLDGWRQDVMQTLQALVGAEVGAFLLPNAGGDPLYQTTGTATNDDEYVQLSRPVFQEFKMLEKLGRHRVGTITSMMQERRKDFVNTSYFQEFLTTKGCFESISLVAAPDGSVELGAVPHVHLHKTRAEERFSDRDEALLRLLLPAFQASVEMVEHLRERRQSLLQMLDALGEAILLVSAGGKVLHVNCAIARLAARDAAFDRVEAEMRRSAIKVSRSKTTMAGGAVVSEMTTATAHYRMRLSLLTDELVGREPAVLVAVERLTPMLPTAEELGNRYSLTARQAQVALLLADGMTDNAIADKLFISPHTARNHSKRVLEKLGVHSRAAVRPALDAL